MYTLFLVVFTAGAAMLNSSGFQERIQGTSNFQSFCDFLTGGDTGEFTVECAEIFSFSGVYMVYLRYVLSRFPIKLRGFEFRWLNIKRLDAAFSISITLFSHHLKSN